MGKRGKSGLFREIEQWLVARMRHRRYQHIFRGHVNNANRGTGYHHRFMGENPPGSRVRTDANGNEMISDRYVDGTYRARVDVQAPDGTWRQKQGHSTFFPDNWTPQTVDRAITDAYSNRVPHPSDPRKWRGSGNGIVIDGFHNRQRNTWSSAWPVQG